MGIAVDGETGTKSITPTKFKFDYPVYLQNGPPNMQLQLKLTQVIMKFGHLL